MTALIDFGGENNPEGISLFVRRFDHDGDRQLRFSDFSKAFLPVDRRLKATLEGRRA